MRSWSDRTAQHEIEAVFVVAEIRLKKKDGTLVAIEFDKLSDEDQAYVRQQLGIPSQGGSGTAGGATGVDGDQPPSDTEPVGPAVDEPAGRPTPEEGGPDKPLPDEPAGDDPGADAPSDKPLPDEPAADEPPPEPAADEPAPGDSPSPASEGDAGGGGANADE